MFYATVNRHRIFHNDIAGRNVLVDDADDIVLIDFEHYLLADASDSADVDGPAVVIAFYECITGRGPWEDGEQDWVQLPERVRKRAAEIMQKTWEPIVKVELDVEVGLMRELLARWLKGREELGFCWEGFVEGLPLPLQDLVREVARRGGVDGTTYLNEA